MSTQINQAHDRATEFSNDKTRIEAMEARLRVPVAFRADPADSGILADGFNTAETTREADMKQDLANASVDVVSGNDAVSAGVRLNVAAENTRAQQNNQLGGKNGKKGKTKDDLLVRLHMLRQQIRVLDQQIEDIDERIEVIDEELAALNELEELIQSGKFDPDNPAHQALGRRAGLSEEQLASPELQYIIDEQQGDLNSERASLIKRRGTIEQERDALVEEAKQELDALPDDDPEKAKLIEEHADIISSRDANTRDATTAELGDNQELANAVDIKAGFDESEQNKALEFFDANDSLSFNTFSADGDYDEVIQKDSWGPQSISAGFNNAASGEVTQPAAQKELEVAEVTQVKNSFALGNV